jgi:hypothetical protein
VADLHVAQAAKVGRNISGADGHDKRLSLFIIDVDPYGECMTFDRTPRSLDSLAWRIAEHGIDSPNDDVLDDVRAFARSALAAGVDRSLVGMLLDPGQPAIARQRAFGVVAAALANQSPRDVPGFVVAA